MYLSFDQMTNWCDQCAQEGFEWFKNADIIVCPESIYLGFAYIALSPHIAVGAQDCSAHTDGAFTGEVSAVHLAEVDVFYSIVGHYERRLYHHETSELVAEKCLVALKNKITPIICVSGLKEMEIICSIIKSHDLDVKKLICAYEPPESIGTGVVLDGEELELVCKKIGTILDKYFPQSEHFVLYGGSVNQNSVKKLSSISSIDGFLIGKASTDFQAFKKIVSSFMNRPF